MLGHIMLGTNNLVKAGEFYDALLAELGATRNWEDSTFVVWGTEEDPLCFSITKPYDGRRATPGNGTMITFRAQSQEQVDRVHAKALLLGALNEGTPGYRGPEEDGFYAGYFRDLDGNKLNVFHFTPPATSGTAN